MIRSITAGLAALHADAHVANCIATASSLMQAKHRLRRSQPPGLIITDLHLPDSRGLDTLRALIDAAPGTPVVVFSACDDNATERAAMALGAHACGSKSALPQNFFQKIKEFRGIATRYCKTDTSYCAFISLAATVIRLK